MAAIEQIEIKGFKAFPKKFNLELEGKHLLLYGENGSGKSSIYWALHCLFNSLRKPDSGKKYFDGNHPQNLLNRNFTPTNEGDLPYVVVNWRDQDEGRNPFISTVSIEGCRTEDRLKELSTCFINHQFLFSFFNFTNSRTVNIFPIFQREILPYIFDTGTGTYISQIYDQIIEDASKLSNKSSSVALKNSIDYFNAKLTTVVEEVNLRVSDIYNDKFKQEDDKVLEIKLSYPSVNPNPDLYLNGFQLKWDYPLIINNEGTAIKAPNKSLNDPIIQIEIKEDGISIEKPQAYFNEAKLTTIALSVRFSLLDMIAPQKGSFLALDDMLISLDMCNRTLVVDFLLSIANKYKIYLLTHDLNFYDLVKKKIERESSTALWKIGKIYMNDFMDVPFPEFIPDKTKINSGIHYLQKHDYPACGVYLRRECEEMLKNLLPKTLREKIIKDDSGNDKTTGLNLNDLILNLERFCEKEFIDFSRFLNLKLYKDVILNTLAHNDSSLPIFKFELIAIIRVLEDLQSVKRSKELIKNCKDLSVEFTVNEKKIAIYLRTREPVLVLEDKGENRLSNYGKCEVRIINDGISNIEESKQFDSIRDVYLHYCAIYDKEPTDDILDVTFYRGNVIRELLD